MKLLVAISSTKPQTLADNTLRWAGRGGFDLKIFIAGGKRTNERFKAALADANYNYYLAIDKHVLSVLKPEQWAKMFDYDLLLKLPDDLPSWRKGRQFKENEIILFAEAVGKARQAFGNKPTKNVHRFTNGAVMYRVSTL